MATFETRAYCVLVRRYVRRVPEDVTEDRRLARRALRLAINHMRDTQGRVEGLFLLPRSDSHKEVCINPQGGHIGEERRDFRSGDI